MGNAPLHDYGRNRRKGVRRHFGYPGKIHVGGDATARACVIIDMSETGAQLEVPAEADIPYEFFLLIGGNANVRRQCRMVWRAGKRMGVQFRADAASSPTAQPAKRPQPV